jgi:hypothetical protein
MDKAIICNEADRLKKNLGDKTRGEKIATRVTELGASGWRRQELYDLMEMIKTCDHVTDDEDVVNVMDRLAGWGSGEVIKTADSDGFSRSG